jgi:hypothetical protein
MKNSIGALKIEEKKLEQYSGFFSRTDLKEDANKGKIKSRLGFVYFVALVICLFLLFVK